MRNAISRQSKARVEGKKYNSFTNFSQRCWKHSNKDRTKEVVSFLSFNDIYILCVPYGDPSLLGREASAFHVYLVIENIVNSLMFS